MARGENWGYSHKWWQFSIRDVPGGSSGTQPGLVLLSCHRHAHGASNGHCSYRRLGFHRPSSVPLSWENMGVSGSPNSWMPFLMEKAIHMEDWVALWLRKPPHGVRSAWFDQLPFPYGFGHALVLQVPLIIPECGGKRIEMPPQAQSMLFNECLRLLEMRPRNEVHSVKLPKLSIWRSRASFS